MSPQPDDNFISDARHKIHRANKSYDLYYQVKLFGQVIGLFKFIFWALFLLIFLGGLGYLGYTNKDFVLGQINDKSAAVSKWASNLNPTQTVTQAAAVPVNCEDIVFTDATKTGTGKPQVSLSHIGKCYNILEANRDIWKYNFSDSSKVNDYAAIIYDKSSDKSLTKEAVAQAITKSLTTNVLDLRQTAPAVPAETTVPSTPASIPATQAPTVTPTPAATATPAVIPVVSPYKEMPLTETELANAMATNNISLVSGDAKGRDIKMDMIFAWIVYYDLGNGKKDYLVLDTFRSKNLPTDCSSTKVTSISISLNITNTPSELAVKVGDKQIWITCK